MEIYNNTIEKSSPENGNIFSRKLQEIKNIFHLLFHTPPIENTSEPQKTMNSIVNIMKNNISVLEKLPNTVYDWYISTEKYWIKIFEQGLTAENIKKRTQYLLNDSYQNIVFPKGKSKKGEIKWHKIKEIKNMFSIGSIKKRINKWVFFDSDVLLLKNHKEELWHLWVDEAEIDISRSYLEKAEKNAVEEIL